MTSRTPHPEPRSRRTKANTRTAGDAARTDSSPDLRADLARLSALIELAWERVIADQPAVSAKRALDLLTATEASLSADDYRTARKRWARLSASLRRGTDITNTEDRLLHLIDRKRRVVDSHLKTSQICTQDEVAALIGNLGAAVRRRVSDPAVRGQIFKDFDATLRRLDTPADSPDSNRIPAAEGQEQAGPRDPNSSTD